MVSLLLDIKSILCFSLQQFDRGILEDCYYSTAFDDYKSALVDDEKLGLYVLHKQKNKFQKYKQ